MPKTLHTPGRVRLGNRTYRNVIIILDFTIKYTKILDRGTYMKTLRLLIITFLLLSFVSSFNVNSQEIEQWGLPDRAKARIGKGRAFKVAYFPDGNRLAISTTIGIWIYDLRTDELLDLLTGHTRPIKSLTFSPDGNTFVTAGDDNIANLWDSHTGKRLLSFMGHRDDVNEVSFHPDGKTLATASDDNTVGLWNIKTGELITSLSGHSDNVHSVSFSSDGRVIASGSYRIGNTLCFWNR